ncbi:VOC family protein [Actinomadura sp. WAC 06369]|uniref:VOC family protein n=1 Tax=Actinomadura sp. WAC 06369 TaxID=2203193 RepID=UPI000F76A5A4|nr:VOC family protein [Actinomadura sp. WAC 06369]RSN46539.1 glyoxalase [Actinomadura sp. WAC 06369]
MRQVVTPMLSYEDVRAALVWLGDAFGFRETGRITMPDGTIGHAEMETEDGGAIMLAEPTPAYRSPRRHAEECAEAAAWSSVPYVIDGVHVYVSDIEAHFERARGAGAVILAEVGDIAVDGRYRAADLEGHRWMFEDVAAG